MPSPFRRGQTDTPINRLALGEVQQKNTDLPQPSVFSLLVLQGTSPKSDDANFESANRL